MNGLGFLLIAVILSVLGTLVLYLRSRGSGRIDHGVDEFRREMRALSPDKRGDDRRRGQR